MKMQRKENRYLLKLGISGIMALTVLCMGSTIASAKGISSIDQAKKLAQQKVKSATVTEVEADTDDGVAVYDVSLHKGNKEYDLKYRQSDAKLLEYDWELQGYGHSDQSKANVSKTKIKKKAQKQVKKAKVRSIILKSDDGRMEYKLSLQKGSYRYTLTYDAKTAKLLEYEQKYTGSKAGAGTSSSGDIGKDKAKQIALSKVPGATVVKIEKDNEDGKLVYEAEMRKDHYEYDIVIDAKSGKVIKNEKEYDD